MTQINTKHMLIQTLNLQAHPEGGYYSETYRSEENCTPTRGIRSVSTAIYFLLGIHDRSRFHVIQSDEMWHHYDGCPLEIHEITLEGQYKVTLLGKEMIQGQVPQYLVPKGHIFGSKIAPSAYLEVDSSSSSEQDQTNENQDLYSLVGCTVAPGFDFQDFHLFSISHLLEQYPQFNQQIHAFFDPHSPG